MRKLFFILCIFSSQIYSSTEVKMGTEFSVFHQPGNYLSNQGYSSLITSEQGLKSGFLLTEKTGYEHFIGMGGQHHGLSVSAQAAYTVNGTSEVQTRASYKTLGRKWGDYELSANFDSKQEDFEWNLGFERAFVMDSYISYAGPGEARLHDFHADMIWNQGVLRYKISPSLGWITTATPSQSNFTGSAKGFVELAMIQENIFDLELVYQASVQHFQIDQSGIIPSQQEPFAGGYFSPRLFIEQVPHVLAKYRPENLMEISFMVGPSFQIIREFQKGSTFGIGAVSTLGFDYRLNQRSNIKVEASYASIADRYNRFQTSVGLGYTL